MLKQELACKGINGTDVTFKQIRLPNKVHNAFNDIIEWIPRESRHTSLAEAGSRRATVLV
jgi:hypothetical protein